MSLKVLSPRFIFPDRNSRTAAGRAVAPQDENNSATASDPLPEAADTRRKLPLGNAQLSRWSRARALRSGRRLQLKKPVVADVPPESPLADPSPVDSASSAEEVEKEEGEVGDAGTPIYMVSDGTGGTLEHAVGAALGQFEHCLVDRACSVETHLFSGIEDGDRLLEIIKQAAKEGALLLFTLADPSMLESAKQACGVWGVPFVDILGPTTEAIATYLGVAPLGISRSERRMPLSEEYFQRIEAIDFTIKQDDGAQPQNLNRAHIVLVGVSRTGKTPLSIYLAQKGYKVANVPIVMGVELPKYLFEINQEKIFGLTINPIVLQTIRKARAKTLGFIGETRSNYSEMDHVREELAFASKIYAHHPLWPVIEVTGKAIEETAAVILRTYHDRRNKCSMPRISRRY